MKLVLKALELKSLKFQQSATVTEDTLIGMFCPDDFGISNNKDNCKPELESCKACWNRECVN